MKAHSVRKLNELILELRILFYEPLKPILDLHNSFAFDIMILNALCLWFYLRPTQYKQKSWIK